MSVLRVFDILAATLVTGSGDEQAFAKDPDAYVREFFGCRQPAFLLCGPSLSMFARLVSARFALPVCKVTFTGTAMVKESVVYSTHNVLEVHLPDRNAWVHVDVDNGLLSSG